MDLRLVEYFLAVVDQGGITNAAKALYVAQPSVSQAIRQLERQVGVDLFDRTGKRVVLNANGAAFVTPARNIVRDVARAHDRVAGILELRAGRLEIAVLSTLSMDPLPGLIKSFALRHPGVQVAIRDPGGPANLISDVRTGRVELGLTELDDHEEGLTSYRLDTQELVVILPPNLSHAFPDPLTTEHLAELPWVVQSRSSATRARISDVLAPVGAKVAVECAHRPAVWELVRGGAGATVVPRRIAETIADPASIRGTEPRMGRDIGLIRRPGPVSPAGRAFLQVCGISHRETPPGPPRRRPDPPETHSAGRRPGRTAD